MIDAPTPAVQAHHSGGEPSTARWRMCPAFILRHAGMPFEWLESLGVGDAVVGAADAVLDLNAGADGEARSAAHAHFEELYDAERAALRAQLHEHARRAEVRGAIFLSNPGMHDGMLAGYLSRDAVPDTSRFRRVERQVYTYLQRFCAKNETTSTFGPVGYGDVAPGDELRVQHVDDTERRTLMARWALEAIAAVIARDPALAAHVPLQRSLLVDPSQVEDEPSEELAALWRRLEAGPATLAELAAERRCAARELLRTVRPLLERGAVVRRIDFPSETQDGLADLRAALLDLPEGPSRLRWEEELAAFADRLKRFAAGNLDERRALLAEIEERFTTLTAREARRGAGGTYADRLVLFEEASSPFRIEIGEGLTRRIESIVAPALDLSARFGSDVQARFRAVAAQVVEEAGGQLDLLTYSERARPDQELSSRFMPQDDALHVDCAAEVVLPTPDPASVTPDERYALPDLCLLGPSPQAVGRDLRVLVARVHHHLLLEGWLTMFAPAPERFADQVGWWLNGTSAGRRTVGLATSRRNKGFYRFPGPRALLMPTDAEGRADAVPATSFTIALEEGELRVLHPLRGSVHLYPPLADLTTYPPIAALTSGPVLHAPVRTVGDHLGRVRVAEATYQRESWDLDVQPIVAARNADSFLALRRLARDRDLPRFVFIRVPSERKPYLLDTRSPFAVDLLRHVAAKSGVCRAEEMLPGPEDLWLKDERGRYTCELRVQFLRLRADEAE